ALMLQFPCQDEPLTGPSPPSLPSTATVRWRPLLPVAVLGRTGNAASSREAFWIGPRTILSFRWHWRDCRTSRCGRRRVPGCAGVGRLTPSFRRPHPRITGRPANLALACGGWHFPDSSSVPDPRNVWMLAVLRRPLPG